MNLFSNINAASTATSTVAASEKKVARQARRYEKALRLVGELASANRSRKTKAGEEKVRAINPGRTVQVTFMLLGLGVTPEAIQQHAPDLASRFDSWAGCGEAIMHAARVKEVDVNAVAHLFGLVAPEDKVVSTKPEAPKAASKKAAKKTAAKKGSSKKAA